MGEQIGWDMMFKSGNRNRVANDVLIDASNLRAGGGVQVAASLIDEFIKLGSEQDFLDKYPWLNGLTFACSNEVLNNLTLPKSKVVPFELGSQWWKPRRWFKPNTLFNVSLTIFGPRYGPRFARKTIVGLADGTSIYPWPEGAEKGNLKTRAKRTIRGYVSRWLFGKEDFLVSESRSLLETFAARTGYPRNQIAVIPNTVNEAVLRTSNAKFPQDLRSALDAQTLLFSYPASLYPHKNHRFLEEVTRELKKKGIDAKFVVTLNDNEWSSLTDGLRSVCINVGVIPVSRIAALNQECDAVFFPSLLESYSATPIEGIATNGLVFASDREFVRDTCGDAVIYFDPLDARSCADTLLSTFSDPLLISAVRRRAHTKISSLITARQRAERYLDLIDSHMPN